VRPKNNTSPLATKKYYGVKKYYIRDDILETLKNYLSTM